MLLAAASLTIMAWMIRSDAAFGLQAVLLIMGFGQGMAMPALLRAVIDRVDPHWAGLASGMVNATLQIGAALSVATIGGLFFARLGVAPRAAEVGSAFSLALLCIAGSLVVSALLIGGLRRTA
jgi:hypothetical protein